MQGQASSISISMSSLSSCAANPVRCEVASPRSGHSHSGRSSAHSTNGAEIPAIQIETHHGQEMKYASVDSGSELAEEPDAWGVEDGVCVDESGGSHDGEDVEEECEECGTVHVAQR